MLQEREPCYLDYKTALQSSPEVIVRVVSLVANGSVEYGYIAGARLSWGISCIAWSSD